MRCFIVPLLALLTLSVCASASVKFDGVWALDLKASDSPEQVMKRMGAPFLERQLAGSTNLEATYKQSGALLTVTTHGPGFSRVETFSLDGQTEKKDEKQTGPYTIRTAWSKDGQELVSTVNFKTNDHRNAELVVTRKLTNGNNTLVLTQTLRVEGESAESPIHRIWQRKAA